MVGREGTDEIEAITYEELEVLVNTVANGLAAAGFAPGDAIALYMPMNLECVAAYLGIILAGLVATGPVEKASRHYASMAIDGDDLVILSRSGDERAKSAHDGNLITFHRVNNFRELVY